MGCVRSAMALWWLSMIIFIVRTRGDIYGHCISSPIVDKNACKKIAEANLEGPIVFTSGPSITEASSDFGGIVKNKPAAVLSPASVGDISKLIKIANESPNLTIAARGNGHAVAGQSQALNGIVVNMTSLRGIQIVQKGGGESYADVKGGEFWVNVLRAAQASGLSPRSWTDYIDLSIGGTLSNAGISGQTYRYGPQISNVLQLEVVTGNGNVTNCSSEDQADLFYSTLGGLGQFGIITGAQIVLQKSFDRASQWRFVYWNFTDFTHDQEILISFTQGGAFDYVEGFVIANNKNGWPSIPFLPNATFNSSLIPPTAGVMLYIIEATLYYDEGTNVNQTVQNISSELGFIRGLEFNLDTSYFDFLYRVHPQELADRANDDEHEDQSDIRSVEEAPSMNSNQYVQKNHPEEWIIGDKNEGVHTIRRLARNDEQVFVARSKLEEQLGELIKEERSDLCTRLSKKTAETFMAFDKCRSTNRVVFAKLSKRVSEAMRLAELD
ncbi:cytokinin dehydrogenase 7-like [Cryptomeria japonica]|uniref:cytokinin dehydrogenase 7-like n=1 Tax=Cryptomeria japonica TaxID=3369 RepID=UPI0027DAA339|nr:cytokinin dehydrogenase 7-like [Cryptomeria japonica]